MTLTGLVLYAFMGFTGITAWVMSGAIIAFGLLFAIASPAGKHGTLSRRLYPLETALAVLILALSGGIVPFPVIFFIVSVQSVELYSQRASLLWVIFFSITSGVIFFVHLPVNIAIVNVLIFPSGYFFFSNFALVSAQAENARRESQALLAQLEEAHRLLREQSVRDPLTRLFNRRYLVETLDRETARSQRHHQPVSLMMIDIDFFKRLNDTYGHLAGDEALKSLGAYLQSACRAEDIACRYGGEEFLIVLPGLQANVASQRAGEILDEVRQLRIPWKDDFLSITVSIGLATIPDHALTGEELIAAADQALYTAKRGGRCQVSLYSLPAHST